MISAFRSAFDARPFRTVDLDEIIDGIRLNAGIAEKVRFLRTLNADAYKQAKTRLPAITPAGVFERRSNRHLVRHSGLVVIDLDDVDDAPDARDTIRLLPFVVLAYLSPSGSGVKAICKVSPIPQDARAHRYAWQAVASKIEKEVGIIADPSGKDLSRLSFMSHDPDASLESWSGQVFWSEPPPSPPRDITMIDADAEEVRSALRMIPADDYDDWWQIAGALRRDLGDQGWELYDEWSSKSSKYESSKVVYQWRYAAKIDGFGLGTIFRLARLHGWTRLSLEMF